MGDFWKPTAEMYSSLFQKPKMAEQLLKKPPFKYLFDIITETTKVTGFGKGLLSQEETAAEFYDSRERKIAYLQKFVDLVKVMGKEQLKVNPGKVVAGLEPEHTNAMLQSLYKLAVSGDPSDPYVAKVLGGGGEVKAQKKQQKPKQQEKRQEPPAQQHPKITRPPSAARRGQRPSGQTQATTKEQGPSRQGNRSIQKQETQQPSQKQIVIESKKSLKQQQPQNYSKKVKQAIQQNEDIKEQTTHQQPVKKVQMGNLKKRKNQNRTDDAGSIGGGVGQITQKQLQSVKTLIQSICQNSTPLSKSIEFINDDVQAMNQQLSYWRKQYNVSKNKMQNELKTTQDALVPLYDKLAEIDEQIKDQKSKIQNAKAQIIKNQSTINALLYSVVKG